MTRFLIPLVAAVTLGLLVVWALQRPEPAPAASTPVQADAPAAPTDATPAPTDATAAPTDATPAPTDATAAPTDATPAPTDATAAPTDATPAPTDATAAPTDATPASGPADDAPAHDTGPPVPAGYAAVAPRTAERRLAFDAAEAVLEDGLDYAAVIETNRGPLVVDLYEEATPVTVNNFVYLALHRFYDGIVFHRVIDGFMAQTGDPTGSGTGGPGYRFADEIVAELRHDGPGVLSMANAGPGTNGSQFFLTFDATPWLDGAHTVFGRVVEGLDVLDRITRVDPQQPAAVALLADPAERVRADGVELPGDGTVLEALAAALGVTPVPGPGYEVAGVRVAIGTVGGEAAAGFFPYPDRMERVTIVTRPRE